MRPAWVLVIALAACNQGGNTQDDSDADSDTTGTDGPTAEAGPDLEVAVGAPLALSGTVTGGDATWALGDGAQATGADVVHTWTEPGNYVVVLSVLSPGQRRASDTTRVTVYRPAADLLPVTSSTVALDLTRNQAWVVLPESTQVAVVDLTTHTVRYVDTCEHPRSVAVVADEVAIACESDAFARVNAQTLAPLDTLPLPIGSRPFGVVGRGSNWFVTAQGAGELFRVTSAGVMERGTLGRDPRALGLGADGTAYATRLRSIDGHGEVLTVGGTILLPYDPSEDSDTTQRGVPTSLQTLAISPDGGTMFVGGTLANTARGLGPSSDGRALTFETTVRATVRQIDLAAGEEDFAARKQLDNHGQVTALALSPRGNWLYVADGATQTIVRFDGYSLRQSSTILDAGHGINGMVVTPDGKTLLVHAWLDRELRAYDVSDPSTPSPPLLWSAPTVDVEPLDPEVLRGKRLFYDAYDKRMARDGYATCGVCHPDGRDDGITWDFTNRGEGLRNTISLEGRAGVGMGPVHWTGNFDEIQDFENDIRNGQGGHGLLTDEQFAATSNTLGTPKAGLSADLDDLAAYVSTLTTTPVSPFEAPEGGAALFLSKGCAGCHAGPSYTDSALDVRHDIGTLDAAAGQRLGSTLDGFDTPTLLGCWATAPYLHDGSADSVEAAITRHAQSDVALSQDQIDQLAAFVRSL